MALLSILVSQLPAIAGVLLPFVITLVNTNFKDSRVHFIAALVICLLGAVMLNFEIILAEGAWASVPAIYETLGKLFIVATGVFHLFYNDSKAEKAMVAFATKVKSIFSKPA